MKHVIKLLLSSLFIYVSLFNFQLAHADVYGATIDELATLDEEQFYGKLTDIILEGFMPEHQETLKFSVSAYLKDKNLKGESVYEDFSRFLDTRKGFSEFLVNEEYDDDYIEAETIRLNDEISIKLKMVIDKAREIYSLIPLT